VKRRASDRGVTLLLQLLALLLVAGCGNMKKQRYARPDTPSAQFPNGTSAQPAPAHSMPHTDTPIDIVFATGANRAGAVTAELPMPLTRELLRRGRERFRIYCAVCHGDDGYAHGIVVRRGFPAPPSLHDERLRDAPVGYVVQVITQGHGLMLSYADRVAPADRWAIAAFVRALQFSQHAPVNELAAEDRQRLGPP
jgi:mono/diheme cytochrome c family protein